jgi:hypothetical protein
MSIRTVIEVNHDYIGRLLEDGHISQELYRWVQDHYVKSRATLPVQGMRILGQRHHSETLVLKVE